MMTTLDHGFVWQGAGATARRRWDFRRLCCSSTPGHHAALQGSAVSDQQAADLVAYLASLPKPPDPKSACGSKTDPRDGASVFRKPRITVSNVPLAAAKSFFARDYRADGML
jgi:hypothetical protein